MRPGLEQLRRRLANPARLHRPALRGIWNLLLALLFASMSVADTDRVREDMRRRQERLCGILVEAGASTLLGGEIERRTANYEAPLPGLPCEFHRRDRTGERVFLMVASSPQLPVKAYFQEQQEKVRREERKGVQEEKTLGVPALLETSSNGRLTLLALKGETLVWIQLDIESLDLGAFRRFAKRVLSLL